MTKYRVFATKVQHLEIEVEADNNTNAELIAYDLPYSDWEVMGEELDIDESEIIE